MMSSLLDIDIPEHYALDSALEDLFFDVEEEDNPMQHLGTVLPNLIARIEGALKTKLPRKKDWRDFLAVVEAVSRAANNCDMQDSDVRTLAELLICSYPDAVNDEVSPRRV